MKQKHFIDIQAIREEDTELRERNTKAFCEGDTIQITEKFDGSNACIAYDPETDKLVAFSRKQELDCSNTLGGFWNFVQGLSEEVFKKLKAHPEYRLFGEWSNKNKIVYADTGKTKHWYMYDIYDADKEKWLTQETVKTFAADCGFEYIHELYYGPFVSWEHCKGFMNSPAYGEKQEGIVVKNQTRLQSFLSGDITLSDSERERNPAYLKIVNDSFKERMKTHEKFIDPEKENAKAEAQKMMESICTRSRIEKELYKMRDEGILPEKISNQDFATIAKNLPRRIFEDLMKEEKELVIACGEYAGKACSSITMKIARDIVNSPQSAERSAQ